MAATSVSSILDELKSLGTEQNLKVYARHGISGDFFGVSYANLDKVARRLRQGGDPSPLGFELWDTGIHDARVLAMKIIRPERVARKQAETWVREVENHLQTCGLTEVVAPLPFAPALAEKWIAASPQRSHWKVYSGWHLIAGIAMGKKAHLDLPDSWFLGHLEAIESGIHDSPNLIRDQQNGTLIAIGSRNDPLRKAATAAARRIGKVEVDHGETSCKTPDAVEYIEKVWARRMKG